VLRPHQNSLFANLLRWPWWVGLLIAAGLFFLSRLFLPPVAALASTFPFIGIAIYAGWRQLKVPGAERIASVFDDLRSLSREEFAALVADAFRREGYEVSEFQGGAADLALRKNGYLTLVSCGRWKVAQAGVASLRELVQAGEAADARQCVYVTIGELSASAAKFAAENGMRVLSGAALVQLLGRRWRDAPPPRGGRDPD
jgi:restriction system protein